MLEELKAKLKNLSPEEVEELKSFLNAEKPADETSEETSTENSAESAEETTETVETPADNADEGATETSEDLPAEEEPAEEPAAEPVQDEESTPAEEVAEEAKAPAEEEGPTDEASEQATDAESETEEAPEISSDEDDDLVMVRGGQAPDEDAVAEPAEPASQNLVTDEGEELPIDYKEILEAKDARILALEAEIASLKNKYEGAFGFSSKPSMPTKVNSLYDDAIDDIKFHK